MPSDDRTISQADRNRSPAIADAGFALPLEQSHQRRFRERAEVQVESHDRRRGIGIHRKRLLRQKGKRILWIS